MSTHTIIILSYHLQLDVEYNFICTFNGFLVVGVDCNLITVTNYNRKLTFFF